MLFEFFKKPLGWLAGVLIVVALTVLVYSCATGGKRAKTEARLNKEQTGAAINSGKDAVETVGQRQAIDAAIDRRVSDANQQVGAATDAAGADAAGRDGLCRLSPNLCR